VQRRGLRLGDVGDLQALRGERTAEPFGLVGAPGRGERDGDAGGGARLALRDAVDDPAHEPGREVLRRPRPAADDQRGGVADAALELADDVVGRAQRAPVGRLADDDAAVVTQVEHRRDGAGPVAEVDDLGLAGTRVEPADRGSRPRGTQIDAEQVAHRPPSSPPATLRGGRVARDQR
jgi:hypothetical protein